MRRVAGRGERDRARRALDGRPGRPQRLPPGASEAGVGAQRPPRRLARRPAPRRAAGPGRPLRWPRCSRCPRRGRRRLPAQASAGIRDLRRLARRRGLARPRRRRAARRGLRGGAAARGATHCFVSASVTRSPSTRSGAWSATCSCSRAARGAQPHAARSASATSTACTSGARTHFALLNHPAVYDQLRTVAGLTTTPAARAARRRARRAPAPARSTRSWPRAGASWPASGST